MELVRGTSLRQRIDDSELGLPARIDCLRAMANALGAAHARGIVHRDLKPENVILAKDGTVKVVDFGLARFAASTTKTTTLTDIAETIETSRAGTPAYIAPEVMMGKTADARSDQFAWGVTAYELLTRESPWGNGLDVVQTVAAVLQKNVHSPPRAPASVGRAVSRAMRKDPDARFRSMSELVTALDAKARRVWIAVPLAIGAVAAGFALTRSDETPPLHPAPHTVESIAVAFAPPEPNARATTSASAEAPPKPMVAAPPPPNTSDLFRRH
jgi:serine/threonine-protein kinase